MRWFWALVLGLSLAACSAAPVANMSEKDLEGACMWGHTKACTELGRIESRKGGHTKAAKLFRQACDEGDPAACCNLGRAYWLGRGVGKDFTQAGTLLGQACDTGLAVCCTNLGLMHKTKALTDLPGEGILALFEKACAGGHKRGCFEAGYMYDVGEHVTQDWPKALVAYGKACSRTLGAACSNMARIYRWGKNGVEYDRAKVKHYFQIACDAGGDERSCREVHNIQFIMNCETICGNLDVMFKEYMEAIAAQGGEDPSSDRLKLIIRVQPHCMQGCVRDGTIKVDCALEAKTVEEFLPCSNY
jgi:TPR repeat protein